MSNATVTGSVNLLANAEGGLYIERLDSDGNRIEAWHLGAVTPEMHGAFARDAHAWLAGTWQPSHPATQMEWDAWRAGLTRVATYEPPPAAGATWIYAREEAPAAWDYLEGPLCTSCGYATVARIEVNGEPTCSECADELQADGDKAALDSIANMLRSAQYHEDATTLSEITAIVGATGRETGQ